MTDNILYIILASSVVSFLILLIKTVIRKDISVFGASLTRFYLIIAILFHIFTRVENSPPPLFIHMGVAVVLIGDIISDALRIVSDRAKFKVYKHMAHVATMKFHAAVDTAPIPFFTVDIACGRLEYANQPLADLLGIDKETLLGRPLFDLLNSTYDNALHELETSGKLTCYIKTAHGMKKAELIGKRTVNGHETLTGSIYLI